METNMVVVHVPDMLNSTILALCDHTIVTISVGPFSKLEDRTWVAWRILTKMNE